MKKLEKLKRSFGGKIIDFISNYERNFEKKHLKAYLKGKKTFNYGFKTVGDFRIPASFPVKEIWINS